MREGLERTPIASVGPAVSDELKSHGLRTDIYPAEDAFFMRPLISAMAAALGKNPPRAAAGNWTQLQANSRITCDSANTCRFECPDLT